MIGMDNTLLKILERESTKEKSSKKKRKQLELRKEKPLAYYSGWERNKGR